LQIRGPDSTEIDSGHEKLPGDGHETVVSKEPALVTTRDVVTFVKQRKAPRRGRGVVRLEDPVADIEVCRRGVRSSFASWVMTVIRIVMWNRA